MGGHSPEDIQKETRTYIMVFAILAALTVITVGISYLNLPTGPAVALAMIVAVAKGSLVALFFMHLISEEKLIYAVLALTVVFFIFLFTVPITTIADGFGEDFNLGGVEHVEAEHD